MSSPFTTGMREDTKSLIIEWGINCDISRLVATLNAQGKLSGSFVNQISGEILWVQPVGGGSKIENQGIDEQTTHIAYQDYDGFAMKAKDRVLASGGTFEYDVVRVHLKEAQRVNELKQVRRS